MTTVEDLVPDVYETLENGTCNSCLRVPAVVEVRILQARTRLCEVCATVVNFRLNAALRDVRKRPRT